MSQCVLPWAYPAWDSLCFPNMVKEIVDQVQEAQRVPGMINPRKNTPRHIEIKLTKIQDRDKILKAAREK